MKRRHSNGEKAVGPCMVHHISDSETQNQITEHIHALFFYKLAGAQTAMDLERLV
jgi:hypothetical protein